MSGIEHNSPLLLPWDEVFDRVLFTREMTGLTGG